MDAEQLKLELRKHVTGKSLFRYFQGGELHYETFDTKFPFTVPVATAHTARFNESETSLSLMKFIRAQLERNLAGQAESQKQ